MAIVILAAVSACRSDTPQPASVDVPQAATRVTVTRVATHPFLARYHLRLKVEAPPGCRTGTDLFPDTGGVSRRNLYAASSGQLYLIGQYDARRIDPQQCIVELTEFRFVEGNMRFVGSFDEDEAGIWTFLSHDRRPERSFEPL